MRGLVCLGVAALVSLPAQAAPVSDVPRTAAIVQGEMAAALDAALTDAAQHGFGGAVLIEVKGVPILKAGYGFANRESRVPFTVDTIAQIGSITKPMTAVAILQLAEAGKLDLRAPVKTYLPDAAEPAASATLHQILTHHAGLADYCGDDFDVLSRADLTHRCMALPLAHPTTEENYSNMGFSFLAAIVEQVSGESWEHYLRAHLWTPLGMRRTGFATFEGTAPGDFATGYLADKPQGVISESIARLHGDSWNLTGNGGIQSSTMDMERFYRGLTQKLPGISPAVTAGMTTPHEHIKDEAWNGYGLAVRLDANNKPVRIGHSGSDGTFFSYFGMLPQQDIFIYIVGNNGEDNIKPSVNTVLKTVLQSVGLMPSTPKPN